MHHLLENVLSLGFQRSEGARPKTPCAVMAGLLISPTRVLHSEVSHLPQSLLRKQESHSKDKGPRKAKLWSKRASRLVLLQYFQTAFLMCADPFVQTKSPERRSSSTWSPHQAPLPTCRFWQSSGQGQGRPTSQPHSPIPDRKWSTGETRPFLNSRFLPWSFPQKSSL